MSPSLVYVLSLEAYILEYRRSGTIFRAVRILQQQTQQNGKMISVQQVKRLFQWMALNNSSNGESANFDKRHAPKVLGFHNLDFAFILI